MATLGDALSISDSAAISLQHSWEDVSLTRDEIVGYVRQELNDQGIFYKPEDLNDSLQDGYDEIIAFSGVLESSTYLPFTEGTNYYDFYTLIPDYIAVVGIWNDNAKRWLVPCTYTELDNMMRLDWEKAYGTPWLFCPLNYRYTVIYPRMMNPTGGMWVFYKSSAGTLLGNSSPQLPPDVCKEILANYVGADLNEQAEEFTKARLRYGAYWDYLQKFIARIKKRDQERHARLGGDW